MTSSPRLQNCYRQSPHAPQARVAIVASSLRLGGAEKQTAYATRALFEAGLDVRLFYLGMGGAYEPVLRQQGIPLSRIYIPKRPGQILARLLGSLRKWKPHVVWATQFGDLRYAAPAGRWCGALTLGGVRSDGLQELKDHGVLGRWLIRFTHGLISNSYRARQNLVSQGIASPNIEVVPNGIDLAEFDALSAMKTPLPLPQGRVIAAAVGSLHPCKRFDRFLEALALARRSEPALAGVLAGTDRGERSALQAKARSLKLAPPDLIFAGECANVPALLSRAGLLILSSEYEGFPNVILEAMAARLPVITTPAGDAARIVKHGQTGYLVAEDDTVKMAGFMVQLAQSPPRSEAFGKAARQRAEKEYNYESLSERLLDSFHLFAGKQGRPSLACMLRSAPANRCLSPAGALNLEVSDAWAGGEQRR